MLKPKRSHVEVTYSIAKSFAQPIEFLFQAILSSATLNTLKKLGNSEEETKTLPSQSRSTWLQRRRVHRNKKAQVQEEEEEEEED
jgi:hypothetical protein